ncbi:MAG: glycosyltransferase family 39 protein [Chloroflexota bacterium]
MKEFRALTGSKFLNHPFIFGGFLFGTILIGYLLSYSGRFFYVTDGYVMYNEARMLVETGRLFTPADLGGQLANAEGGAIPYVKRGRDGQYYSKYGPGMALLEALVMFVGKIQPQHTLRLLGLMNPILTAATAVLLYLIATMFTHHAKRAALIALAFAFTTFAWPYVAYDYSEPLQAFCVAAAIFFLFRWHSTQNLTLLSLSGLMVGYAAATKFTLLLVVPGLLVYLIARSSRAARLRATVLFMVPIAAIAILLGLFNYARFGSPFDFGYDAKETFSTPFATGAFGLAFSLNKGMIFFAPLVLLAPLGLYAMRQRWLPEAIVLVGIFLANLLLYSMWWAWQGGLSWGPRFLVPFVGLLLVPIVFLLDRPALQVAALILMIFGFGINALGMIVDVKAYRAAVDSGLSAAQMTGKLGSDIFHISETPEFSQIPGHLWLLAAFYYGRSAHTGLTPENAIFRAPLWITKYPQAIPQSISGDVISPWILSTWSSGG